MEDYIPHRMASKGLQSPVPAGRPGEIVTWLGTNLCDAHARMHRRRGPYAGGLSSEIPNMIWPAGEREAFAAGQLKSRRLAAADWGAD
jgi:hypothetical protein